MLIFDALHQQYPRIIDPLSLYFVVCYLDSTDAVQSGISIYAPLDCTDILALGNRQSGVYTVYVGAMQRTLLVYCDMLTDGGGWTVGTQYT